MIATLAVATICLVTAEQSTGAAAILVPLDPSSALNLTSPENGVKFDLNADGVPEQTAWTAPGSRLAFLAIDRNGNGTIDDGSELFGNHTLPGVSNGFTALSEMNQALGAPKKGRIFEGDPLYDKLLLWEDANHNGISEPSELRPAKEIVTGVGLGYSVENRRDGYGNRIQFRGWSELRTGGPDQPRAADPKEHSDRLHAIYDVAFVQQ